MYYFGLLKHTNVVEVFYSKVKPTKQSHGNTYLILFGGYNNKSETIDKASYQYPFALIRFHDNRKKECRNNHDLHAIAGIG